MQSAPDPDPSRHCPSPPLPCLQAVQSEAQRERQAATARAVALLEAKATRLCDMLSSVLEDTKGRIEKKQAQTYEELVAEQHEAEEVRREW